MRTEYNVYDARTAQAIRDALLLAAESGDSPCDKDILLEEAAKLTQAFDME